MGYKGKQYDILNCVPRPDASIDVKLLKITVGWYFACAGTRQE
jgi:hypothetical protein